MKKLIFFFGIKTNGKSSIGIQFEFKLNNKMFKNYSKILFTISCILFINLNKCNGVEHVHLEFTHDPSFPNTMTVLALQYELISDKVVQINAQFHISEELSQGTKVFIQI